MRKAILKLTTQKDLVTHETNAQTFGELKKDMPQIKWSGMRVVERSTKTTLQMDDAVLPQGDFILFLVPEKVKSGRKTTGGIEKLPKPVEECSYNECRSHMSWLNRNKGANLDMSGGTDDLRLQLMDYYDGKKETPKAEAKPKAAPEKKKDKKKKKNGIFGKGKQETVETVDPVAEIEDSRERINKAVDVILKSAIHGGVVGIVPQVLTYTASQLEKESREIHTKLRTSRANARYID